MTMNNDPRIDYRMQQLRESASLHLSHAALFLFMGSGSVFAAGNTEFIAAHEQAFMAGGVGAIALGAVSTAVAGVRNEQAIRREKWIRAQQSSEESSTGEV